MKSVGCNSKIQRYFGLKVFLLGMSDYDTVLQTETTRGL